jgi:hypothetical protein
MPERNMPLRDILRCILSKKGLSAVIEVRHYFGAAEKEEQMVSKQDYLQQRQKLNPFAPVGLLDEQQGALELVPILDPQKIHAFQNVLNS